MSDLRTRISDAVLWLGGFCRGDANELADAVIAELGLKLDKELGPDSQGRKFRRYVTDWKADDE